MTAPRGGGGGRVYQKGTKKGGKKSFFKKNPNHGFHSVSDHTNPPTPPQKPSQAPSLPFFGTSVALILKIQEKKKGVHDFVPFHPPSVPAFI